VAGALFAGVMRPPGELPAASGPQVREHRQHPSVAVLRAGQVQLHEDVADVLGDGRVTDHQLARDGGVGAALGHQREHLPFAGSEPVQRIGGALPYFLHEGDTVGAIKIVAIMQDRVQISHKNKMYEIRVGSDGKPIGEPKPMR